MLNVLVMLVVLVGLPALEVLVNFVCNRRRLTSACTKRALAPLLIVYYTAIVAYDAATHIMDLEEGVFAAEFAPALARAGCPILLHTMPNHRANIVQLVDLTFHFFVMACMIDRTSTRILLVGVHFALWGADNLTYSQYNPGQHGSQSPGQAP